VFASTLVLRQPNQCPFIESLVSLRQPLRHGELSRSTCERFSANLVYNEVLARRRVALVGRQPVEEVLHVAGVVGHRTRCNEAVHLHRAVVSLPEFPGTVADVEFALGCTDGVHVAESAEPDRRLESVEGNNVTVALTKP
jgi:hypothetical protein